MTDGYFQQVGDIPVEITDVVHVQVVSRIQTQSAISGCLCCDYVRFNGFFRVFFIACGVSFCVEFHPVRTRLGSGMDQLRIGVDKQRGTNSGLFKDAYTFFQFFGKGNGVPAGVGGNDIVCIGTSVALPASLPGLNL